MNTDCLICITKNKDVIYLYLQKKKKIVRRAADMHKIQNEANEYYH